MSNSFKLPTYTDYQWDEVNEFSWFADEEGRMFYPYYRDTSFISWLPMENNFHERNMIDIEYHVDKKIIHWSDGAQIWCKLKYEKR